MTVPPSAAPALSTYSGATPTAQFQTWAASTDVAVSIDVPFTLTAQITLPAYRQVYGNGHTITKGFNGDMFDMSAQECAMHDLLIAGGASAGGYTGRGIVINSSTTSLKQRLFNVDILDTMGPCLEFVRAATQDHTIFCGMQFEWLGGGATRYIPAGGTSTSYPSIKMNGSGALGDPSNDPETQGFRRFVGVDSNGTTLVDLAGSCLTYIEACSAFYILWQPGTRYASVYQTRLVQSPTIYGIGSIIDISTTIDGSNGPVTLGPGATQCFVQLNTNIVTWVDDSGNADNQIWDNAPREISPIVASPPNFSIGNGTLTAMASRQGTSTEVDFLLKAGTTTTVGTQGVWNFQLPSPYNNYPRTVDVVGTAQSVQGNFRAGAALMAAGSASVVLLPADNTGTGWGTNYPQPLAKDDVIRFKIRFPIG